MSRVIKFRAWDAEKNQFVLQGEIVFSNYGDTMIEVVPNDTSYIGDSCHNGEPQRGRFIVTQFTGLHDKSGKEIYEGDIVRILIAGEASKYTYTVEWVDFSYKLIHATPRLDRLCWGGINRISEIGWEVEVIGNIYENPELLQEKGGEG